MSLGILIYDEQDAAKFIAERTSQQIETAARFLEARIDYQKMLGQFGSGEREAMQKESRSHADLLPIDNIEYLNLVAIYVHRKTNLSVKVITDMIAEETAYMVVTKIMDAPAYADIRAWADQYG